MMTSTSEQVSATTKGNSDALIKAGNTAEQLIKANADGIAKANLGPEQISATTKANAEALSRGGSAAVAGLQELTRAYQELATRNAEKLTASIQALTAVTSPTEFFELQQKLIQEGIESAVADGRHIAELTSAIFTAAFAPVQNQIETLQRTIRK